MSDDWSRFLKSKDFEVEVDTVLVQLADNRRHRVRCQPEEGGWRLRTVVARASVLTDIEDLPLRVWKKNRATKLVGFRIDERGRLVGESWVAKAGVTADEFQLHLRLVAAESDHLEHMLTGADTE